MSEETTRALLRWAEQRLGTAADIANPRWEARHLLQDLTGWTPTDMMMEPDRAIPGPEMFRRWVEGRVQGIPASRLTGFRDFMGRRFAVSPGTLDPRADSEVLVETALRLIPKDWDGHVMDLGTGTGCLLLSILAERPAARGTGIDLSPDAIATAEANARSLSLQERARVAVGSWTKGVADGSVDLLISNPPYIRTPVLADLDANVRDHDPVLALDGGADGLSAYRAIVSDAGRVLSDEAFLVLEIGWDQREGVTALLDRAGFADIVCVPDLGGRDRVIYARNSLKTAKKGLE